VYISYGRQPDIYILFFQREKEYLQLYTSLPQHCQQQKANLIPQDLFATDCLSSTDKREWKSKKDYHRKGKDVPCDYRGNLMLLLGCKRLAFEVAHLHNQQERNNGSAIYSSYKKFSSYHLSALNLSMSTIRRDFEKLVKLGILIKEEAPNEIKKRFGAGKRDNTRCWSLNYDLLWQMGITPTYLMSVLKGDKRILTKNFAAKKIEQTLKNPSIPIKPITSNYKVSQRSKKQTCHFEKIISVNDLYQDSSVDKIFFSAGVSMGRIPFEFRRFQERSMQCIGWVRSSTRSNLLNILQKQYVPKLIKEKWHLTGYKVSNNQSYQPYQEPDIVIRGDRGSTKPPESRRYCWFNKDNEKISASLITQYVRLGLQESKRTEADQIMSRINKMHEDDILERKLAGLSVNCSSV
jgi:hypothetical protein